MEEKTKNKMTEEELNEKIKFIKSKRHLLTQDEIDQAVKETFREFYKNLEVGDGVTYHLYSDAHACTIIRRTKSTIVIQEDKAILSPDFVPRFSDDGFYCYNSGEQSYSYERNDKGDIKVARWSEKFGAFRYLGKTVTAGRHEYYDYNF